ncbi:hypothetical protein P280DRAFT_408628, partial [Massarina eburnea CBS 473.64]
RPSHRRKFKATIICALPLESVAILPLLDERWDEDGDRYGRTLRDDNTYTTGRIGRHAVVLTLVSHMGKVNAVGAAVSMRSSYGGL